MNDELEEIYKQMEKELKKLKWTLIASGVAILVVCGLFIWEVL